MQEIIERVAVHVRCHYSKSPHRDDLEQVARIAAWRALQRTNTSRRGWKTCVFQAGEGAALQYLRDKAQVIRVPARKWEQGLRIEIEQLP